MISSQGLRTLVHVKKIVCRMCTAIKQCPQVAVCQMTSTADKVENFSVAQNLVHKAVLQGASMVFLPEAFDYIAESKEQSIELSESLNGRTVSNFKELAVKSKVWLSLGGFHQKADGNKLKNSHLIIDDHGIIRAVYTKVHLFDVNIQSNEKKVQLRESDHTMAGNEIVPPVETPVGKVGLSICYDLRFPEASSILRNMGAEILTYPSAFTVVTGRAHWEILLRNKAIENQCYVIAAAQCGKHNSKRISFGHSMIIDPFGRIIASLKDEPGIAMAEINLQYLKTVRQEMPLELHRRDDLYGTVGFQQQLECSEEHFLFGGVRIDVSQIFYRSQYSVGFVNKKPVLPGHVLVSPRRVVKRLADLIPDEVADLFCSTRKIQAAIELEHGANSSTIAVQDGPEAGQTIQHLHVHVLPRKLLDFERNDDVYALLEKHDAEDRSVQGVNMRSADQMKIEADQIRKRLR